MTENPLPPDRPADRPADRPVYQPLPPRSRARRGRPLVWLFTLLLLGAVGYGAWFGWRWTMDTLEAVSGQQELLARLARDLGALRAQADELSTRQTDLAAAVQRNGVDVAAMNGRLDDSEQAMSRLSETVEGGRTRLQLAAVEQLMLMANDRLLLAHDSAAALKALDLADQRLAALNDPRLFRIREALAQERAALTSLTLPDYTGLALTLSEVSRRIAGLPLRVRVPERFDAPPTTAADDGSALGRIWAAVKETLSGIFVLRRHDGPKPRLLGADEEALVVQILQLKIEGARLALLANDTRTFHQLVTEAAAWLVQYYDAAHGDVQFVHRELQRLGAHGQAPALPDISRSLTLLRAQLNAAAR